MERLRPEAVLVHAYNAQEPKRGLKQPVRPNLRGRLQIAAAKQLQKHGVENFVFTGGKLAGGQFPPIARVNATEFIRRSNLSEENVFVCPAGYDTSTEIDHFLKLAKAQNWIELGDLANQTHISRIGKIYQKRRRGVESLSTEKVLTTFPSFRNAQRYQRVIDKLHCSEEERRFRIQERFLNLIQLFPGGETLLRILASRLKRIERWLIEPSA